jgi:hypothetical protein
MTNPVMAIRFQPRTSGSGGATWRIEAIVGVADQRRIPDCRDFTDI